MPTPKIAEVNEFRVECEFDQADLTNLVKAAVMKAIGNKAAMINDADCRAVTWNVYFSTVADESYDEDNPHTHLKHKASVTLVLDNNKNKPRIGLG